MVEQILAGRKERKLQINLRLQIVGSFVRVPDQSRAEVQKRWPFLIATASGKFFLLFQAIGIFLYTTRSFRLTVS